MFRSLRAAWQQTKERLATAGALTRLPISAAALVAARHNPARRA